MIIIVLDQSTHNSALGGQTLVHGVRRSVRLLGQDSGPCNWAPVV